MNQIGCMSEPRTLAEYHEQVALPGVTDDQARRMAPHLPPDEPLSYSETPNSSADDPPTQEGWLKLQIAGTSAKVPKLSILAEADAIAGENRSRDYGHPLANHRRIAEIWNLQLERKLSAKITPREVALMMIGLKLAREINSPKRDNLIDAAGYIKCVDMIDEAGGE